MHGTTTGTRGRKRPLRVDVRSPYVGKISPAYEVPGGDRLAFYEWQGKFFDVHGREIVPGEPLVEDEADYVQLEMPAAPKKGRRK